MGLKISYLKYVIEAGTDEAGRGCLAGPVVAAAVILPINFNHPLLNDSKQLTHKQRELLRPIIENNAIAFGIASVFETEIDQINILQASILAMHKAIDQLQIKPEHIIVDGNKFNSYKNIPHTTIVKGDAKFMSIAAASVLAKTYRDTYMENLHNSFPAYNWEKNKGYPTKEHRTAIASFGITEHHRKSFKLLPDQFI
ncbi:ribonuclease HII [Lutibacter sp.]|uniref:ribonuclease HII n=1 Tax=Lutibacter sp. TaxID=1925666 RepID=UPI0027371A1D|nr:ribonuclease HII [Lutibacter sp.]MDP3314300.1 ribonuclease HII [Lutibacter sp.]